VRRLILAGLVIGGAGFAQAPLMDAKSAQAIVAGCAAHAAAKGQSQAIATVDRGGGIVAALRMDRVGAGPMTFAIRKAEAVAAWGFATAGMAQGARDVPGFANAPGVVTVPGGVPVFAADGRTRIGAVGVSGEDPADDVACAVAGIKAAGLKAERSQ
jgi:glc operon protein GlcG